MTTPRVAFDARLWHNTGIGRYIRSLLPRLTGLDLIVYVLPEDVEAAQAAFPHAAVRPCPAKPFSIAELLFWHKELRAQPFALFHAPHLNVPASGDIPLVTTIHDLIPLKFPGTTNSILGTYYFLLMANIAAGRSTRVITDSVNTKQDLEAMLEARPEKIRVIPLAPDAMFSVPAAPERIAAVKARFGLTGPYILYSGQWKKYKNLETLFRAFAQLKERHPGLKLVLVGREDAKQHYVARLLRELKIGEDVVKTGYLEDEADLVAIYQAARVFAFPSRYEGFGLPPLEAMAAGVPVVSSNAASLPEAVGDAGLLVPPDEVDTWVSALDSVLTDEALRTRLIEAGRARAAAMSWDAVAKATLRVYREIVGS